MRVVSKARWVKLAASPHLSWEMLCGGRDEVLCRLDYPVENQRSFI